MPARDFPNLGLRGGYDEHEAGWGDDQNLNLLTLSVLSQATVEEKLAAVPGVPAPGTVILLDETNVGNPNAIAVFEGPVGAEVWTYIEPKEGWLLYNQDAGYYEKFDGTVWAELATGGGGAALEIEEEGVSVDAAVTKINMIGATVVQTAPGEVDVEITGGGGGGGADPSVIGAHRYWRVDNIVSSDGASDPSVAELRLRSSVGGADLAVTTATATNTFSGFPVANLCDSNAATMWAGDGLEFNPTFTFDMGADVAVRQIMCQARNDGFYYQTPRSLDLSWSDDGIVFTKIGNFEFGAFTAAGQIKTATVSAKYPFAGAGGNSANAVGAHRYWRLSDIGTSSAGQAVATSEIRLRSTVGGADLAVSAGRCIEENGAFPIANTYDGNVNTLWGVGAAANTPLCVIVYDMGAAVPVREVAVTARNDTFFYQAPRSFTLAWSDDDEFYTEVGQVELGTFTAAAQVRTAEVPVSYPYGNVAGLSTVQTEAADYTLAPNDVRNYIRLTAAGTKNINIATNATTALPTAGEWNFRNVGAGAATIVPAGGVTVNVPAGGSLVVGQGMTVMLKRVAVDEFDLIGQTL